MKESHDTKQLTGFAATARMYEAAESHEGNVLRQAAGGAGEWPEA